MAKKRKPESIDQTLRRAIKASGQSANQIAKATGVKQTTISGFLRGRNIGMQRGAEIAAYLGLKLVGPETVEERNRRSAN